jgi:hypothetical protein
MTLWFGPPIPSPGPLAGAISLLGLLAVSTYVAWRFGPTLLRVTGWAWLGVAWACGSQGGYGYCAGFLVLGVLAWSAGTIWYVKRRGRWPSAVSERVLTHGLGTRARSRSSSTTARLRHPE